MKTFLPIIALLILSLNAYSINNTTGNGETDKPSCIVGKNKARLKRKQCKENGGIFKSGSCQRVNTVEPKKTKTIVQPG